MRTQHEAHATLRTRAARSDQINALLLASQSDQAKIARRFIAMLRISVPFNKAEVWV